MSEVGAEKRGTGIRDRWAIVLAGGSGRRLSPLTADAWGRTVPKQFCALAGERSLLQMALARADRRAPRERQLVVVNQAHEHWWSRELGHLPPENVVVQPADRGTAVGLFLPLLQVHRRDPGAEVVVLPSDHFFAREDILAGALEEATSELARHPGRLLLLGVEAARPDPDLGWIEVGGGDATARARPVAAFREKPPSAEAHRLFERGALINSLIIVAAVEDLMSFFERRSALPEKFRGASREAEAPRDRVASIYSGLDSLDLSTDLLEAATEDLLVLRLDRCGWSDLGTTRSVRECLLRQHPPRLAAVSSCRAPVDLSLPRHPLPDGSGISAEELARFVEML